MKVKCDFVTNSSSTSFCLWGISMDIDMFLSANGVNEEDRPGDFIEDIMEKSELDYYTDYESDIIYLGISPERMLKNETLAEFEERIKSLLANVNCGDRGISFISEVIYN